MRLEPHRVHLEPAGAQRRGDLHPDEACAQYHRPPRALGFGQAVVDIMRREQPKPDVMVLGVVPGEEVPAVTASVLERPEAVALESSGRTWSFASRSRSV